MLLLLLLMLSHWLDLSVYSVLFMIHRIFFLIINVQLLLLLLLRLNPLPVIYPLLSVSQWSARARAHARAREQLHQTQSGAELLVWLGRWLNWFDCSKTSAVTEVKPGDKWRNIIKHVGHLVLWNLRTLNHLLLLTRQWRPLLYDLAGSTRKYYCS